MPFIICSGDLREFDHAGRRMHAVTYFCQAVLVAYESCVGQNYLRFVLRFGTYDCAFRAFYCGLEG